jgi:hypothetical protein
LGTPGGVDKYFKGAIRRRRRETHMDQANNDVSNVQYYLRGVNLPAGKEEVASAAESNGAPQDMVTQIRNADTECFKSPEEVMRALQSGLDCE